MTNLIAHLEKKASAIFPNSQNELEYLKDMGKPAQTLEIVQTAVSNFKPEHRHHCILKYISNKYRVYNVCFAAVLKAGINLHYVPDNLRDFDMCMAAVMNDREAMTYVPKSLKNEIEKSIPKEHKSEWEAEEERRKWPDNSKAAENVATASGNPEIDSVLVSDNPAITNLPSSPQNTPTGEIEKAAIHDISNTNNANSSFYYVSDIHIEHQLALLGLPKSAVQQRLNNKIQELKSRAPGTDGRSAFLLNKPIQNALFVAGDVANSVELEKMFYQSLNWNGHVFAVLGNHELWNDDQLGASDARPIDDIISDYKQAMPRQIHLLENELFLHYKGRCFETLDEQTILNATDDELQEACSCATFMVLGGIGFSGLNSRFNANSGLYRNTVSRDEDKRRSERFRKIHEKILRCATKEQVIVLTHNPISDWSDGERGSNWVYVNGHTHQNTAHISEGATILADNQIGYSPTHWQLNKFTIDQQIYNPFKDYEDGLHKVTRQQYREFNVQLGTNAPSLKWPGDLYMSKHDDAYMFFIEGASLCLLEGNSRHKLSHDISYYDKHLSEYASKIKSMVAPYHQALQLVSNEVTKFGGSGNIHGCIIDIDFWNHIFLNPYDGKITPYYATDMECVFPYPDLQSLLEKSPMPPRLPNGAPMLTRYLAEDAKHLLPILGNEHKESAALPFVPEIITDRSMYQPSRIMRTIQYIFDQNVVRIWNDDILKVDKANQKSLASGLSLNGF